MLKMYETTNSCRYEVECIHPDIGSQFYTFVCVMDNLKLDLYELRKQIEQQVNPAGYWHEVKITQVFAMTQDMVATLDWNDGQVIEKEITEEMCQEAIEDEEK